MRFSLNKVLACLLTMFIVSGQLVAGDAAEFLRDVKPIFKARCFACHGALKQESGLRLDAVSLILKGGDNGAAFITGNSADSLLIEKVTAADEGERMPPEGKPLTAEEIGLIKNWIDQGAKAPENDQPEIDTRMHWAFQLPIRGTLPTVDLRSKNPIDAFLAVELQARKLKQVPEADKRLLLRRVYLDLIGLPPTHQEMDEFLADNSADAYERLVDRLLESPHYGERWGRHWMDIWRYTDWYGLGDQLRYSQKHIWHWRDWVIESLNADKGYDRMILEMLAADEIAPTDRDALRATGFLARDYFLFNRTTWLDETIEHTSKAFLGLTMNCTKCHDHKYDPITQVDYYRMRAIFEPYQVRLDAWPGETDLEKNGLPRVFDAHPDQPTYLHVRGDEKNPDTSRVLSPHVPAFLMQAEMAIVPISLPAMAVNPALQPFVPEDQIRVAEQEIERARAALNQAREQLASVEKRLSISAKDEVESKDGNTKENKSSTGKIFLQDDFSKPNPDVWETGPGKWEYKDGLLVQSQTGSTRAYLRSLSEHPADFQATLKFKTTGGQMWRSVGLCYDVADGREKLVYLSSVSPGSKLQISYNAGSGHVYPNEGKQDRPVKVNEPYEMTVAVRGQLVNVSLNGEHALAYEIPLEREKGRIELVAFDAAVEFDSLEIRELPADVKLVQASLPAAKVPAESMTLPAAKAAALVAEKSLAVAELKPATLITAQAADSAKHAETPPENLRQLIVDAALAARKYESAKAEEAVARADQKLLAANDQTKQQAENELKAAQGNLEKTKAAVIQPGEQYLSLTASLKALEGPDETEASRRQPYPRTSTGRRTAFAQWIASRQNPLTARVAVNHIWMRHFGQPLVESVSDFGRRAEQPAQQALLDWLAVEFMEKGWSMKHLHRLMATSYAYRLSSSAAGADEHTIKSDPGNEYYWRRKPVRMESEVIRDSMLQLAGVLNPEMGGPTINPKSDDTVYRRSLYFTHSRDDEHPFLSMFDDADILRCYRRTESIVPQQSLAMANSKLSLAMARKISARLEQQLGAVSDAQFIESAYELILAVTPTEEEMHACLTALQTTSKLLAERNNPQPTVRARENLTHALLNHNDFITIR